MNNRNKLLRKTPLKRKAWMKQKRAKPRRSGRVRDTEYMLAVKQLPCAARFALGCAGPIEADHAGRRPLGRKCNDNETIPLCREHHRQRTDGYGFFREALPAGETVRMWLDRAIAETRDRVERRRAA